MPIDPRRAAAAVLEAMSEISVERPGVSFEREAFGALATSGVAVPMMNGVIVVEPTDPDAVESALDRVAATGLPHCLQVRSPLAAALGALARRRGLERHGAIPLLALEDPAALVVPARPDELQIRTLDFEEVGLHVAVAAQGFAMPAEVLGELLVEEMFTERGARLYAGFVGEEPVVTAMVLTAEASAGVSTVATLPAFRRRGYAAALTARAVADSLLIGAELVWLQSSEAGLRVYRSLGFEIVEDWECWVTPDGWPLA